MLSTMHQANSMPPHVEFLYSTKFSSSFASSILFLERLQEIKLRHLESLRLTLFLTGETENLIDLPEHQSRRIATQDLSTALGPESLRNKTVCYVCGPPRMTDEFVEYLANQAGMAPAQVFYEKWW